MKLIDYIEAEIPNWALSYLVNADASGLEDGEQAQVDEWHKDCCDALAKECPEAVIDLWTEDGEGGFTHHPAFGLACDCISGAVVALVDNSDPRPEMAPPGFVGEDDGE